MNGSNDAQSLKAYPVKKENPITAAAEDVLKMIYRHAQVSGFVRINFLAARLNANPASATKTVLALKELELVEFEKYGVIYLTLKGEELGRYLIHRHNVVHRFLCLLNGNLNELEQTEKIEHSLNRETVQNLEHQIEKMEKNDKKTLNANQFNVIL